MEKPTNSHQTKITSQINLKTVDLARIILEQFNNDYFRAIFEYTFQFIGLLSPDGILLEVNQTALNAIGLTKEDVIGKPFWETGWWLISPETQTQLREAIALSAQGETIRYQTEVWGREQNIIPVDFCLRPIMDESGKVILLIPEGWDLRQQKQIESEKLDKEKKYQTLYEQVPVGIVYVDQNKNIIECNNYFCSLLGYQETELTKKKITDITHPEDYNLHLPEWRDLWDGKIKQYSLEKRYLKKDGTILWASVTVSNVQEENGKSYNVAIVQDITEQKQTQARYRKAQQIAKIGNWELNLQDNTLYWSDQIYEIFELDKSQTSPSYEGFLSLVHPDDRNLVNSAYTLHLEKGVPYDFVHRLLMKNGEIKYVRERCETYYDFNGKPIASVGTTQDITEQREIENILSNIIEGNTSSLGGAEFFPILASHIANTINVSYVLISRLDGDYLETLGFFAHGKIQDFYRYRWFGTPCECVIKQGELSCTQGIQQEFLQDKDLINLNANSYVGLRLQNQAGKAIGHICVLDEKTMTSAKIAQIKTILQVFAGRASAELERLETTQKIRELNETLELRIALRTAQLEKKERENRLLKERLEYLLTESPAVIYTCKTEGDYGATYMSPNIEKITGYSPNQFTSQSDFWASKIHPEDKEKIFAELPQLFEHNHHQEEYRYLHQDGHYIWLRDELRLIRDDKGNPLEIIGYWADISDRKEAELALESKTRELDQFFTSAMDLLCIANLDGYFISLNPEWEKTLGYPLTDLKGAKFLDYVHPQDLGSTLLIMDNLRKGATIRNYVNRYRCADGSYRFIEWCSIPYQNKIYASARDITNRLKIEKTLREKNLFIEKITDSSPNITYLYDVANQIHTYMSSEVTKILGYTIEEIQAISPYFPDNIMHSEDIPNFLEHQQRVDASQEGENLEIEFRLRKKDGNWCWLSARDTVFSRGEDGQIKEILGTAVDISDRKQAEIILHQQNQLLNTISNAQAQFITAKNRLILFEELLSGLLDLTDSEYGFIGEVLFRDDGSALIEETFLKIRGIPYLKIHAVTNVAWNRETQKFYEENQEKGMEFDNMNTLFGAVIMTGKPVIANNPQTDPRRGGTPEGHPILNSFLGLPFFSGTNLVGIVGIANRPEGYNQEIINYLQPLLITCGNLIQGYRLDRQRQAIQLQLQQTNQELIRATRLKDEFLANMSHELRTPLNAIMGLSEALQEQVYGDLNPQQLKYLKTIEDSGQHLLDLINDILDLAKIASGNMELDLQPTAIVSVCDSSLIFVRQQAQKKNINLRMNYIENLKNLEILIDERRIRQVLINLLNNAVKFTSEFGSVTVDISLITEGTAVKIGVKDTGIGIAKEDLDNLFKPFVQVESALNRKYNGTGLGLALVRKMVELHGGEVGVTSELGVGSYFYFCLPCQLEGKIEMQLLEENNPDSDLNSSKSSFNPQNKRSCRILLVEDQDADILTITNYLQTKGYQIVTAKNGNSAFNLLETESIDLILMDISLPEMDGVETIRQIRLNPHLSKIPIIVLTASAMKGDREYYLQCGADEYLAKPVKLKQLLETISRY